MRALCEVVEWVSGQRSKTLTAGDGIARAPNGKTWSNLSNNSAHGYPDKLPADGKTFGPDLDNVERATDRR